MRNLLFGLFVFFSLPLSAQKFYEFSSSTTSVGKDISGKELIANSLTFKYHVESYYCDLNTLQLTVYLRPRNNRGYSKPNGRILFLDPSRQQTLWHKRANYLGNLYQQYGDVFIHNNGTQVTRFDLNSGKMLWRNGFNTWYKDPWSPIAFSYPFVGGLKQKNMLEGIDLYTGERVWKRYLDNTYGWNEVYQIEEQEVLIQSSGLHLVNTQNGRGWSYNAVTGTKKHGRQIASAASGIALGLLTGTYVYTNAGPDIISGINSNLVSNDESYFMSSLNEIVCIDTQGEIVWSKHLSDEESSQAGLILIEDVLYHVNYGSAKKFGMDIPFGLPYLAAYNATSGKELYQVYIPEEERILDFVYHTDSTALLIFSDRFSQIDLKTGEEIMEKEFQNKFWGFLGSQNYRMGTDSTLYAVYEMDSSSIFVMNSNKEVQTINKELNSTENFPIDELYILKGNFDKFKVVENQRHHFLVDKNNKIIASLDHLSNISIAGSVLYATKENNLIMLDLNPFID